MKRKGLLELIVGVALTGVLAIALVMTGCAPEAEAPPVAPPEEVAPPVVAPHWHWRFQGIGPPSDIDPYFKPFIKSIETMSEGQIEIELFYSSEIVPNEELLAAVKAGTVDGAISFSALNGTLTRTSGVEGLIPCTYRNPTEVDVLWYHRGIFEIVEADYAEYGVKYVSPFQFTNAEGLVSTKPVERLEDLEGLKVASWHLESCPFEQAGMAVVSVPPEEFYLSGKTGVIDGVLWCNAYLAYVMGLHEVFPYYLSDSVMQGISGSFYMNQEQWDSLPKDLQSILFHACRSASFSCTTRRWDGESKYRKYFIVTKFSEEDHAKLFAGAEECWYEMARGEPKALEILDIVLAYMDELEASHWHR